MPKNWTENQSQQVLWNDDSKWLLACTDAVRKEEDTVKRGGCAVMVWRCISAFGVGDLLQINGIMNTEKDSLNRHAISNRLKVVITNIAFKAQC